MHSEKRKKFIEIYEKKFCKENYIKILIVIIILTIIFCILDECPEDYIFEWIKYICKRQDGDFSIINSQILALWAATNSFLMFYMGHVRDEYFGVKIIDSFKVKFPMPYCVIYIISDIFCLGITFWAVLYRKELVIVFYELIHFLNMFLIIIVVIAEMSRNTIQHRLAEETSQLMREQEDDYAGKNILGNICIAMLKKCDDEKYFDAIINSFNDIICKYVDLSDGNEQVKNKIVYEFASQFADFILLNSKERNKVKALFQEMLVRKGKSEDKIYLYARRGIVRTVVDNISDMNCPELDDIIGIRYEQAGDVRHWAFVYNSYMRMESEEYYRHDVSKAIISLFSKEDIADSNFEKVLLDLWMDFAMTETQEGEDGKIDYHLGYFERVYNEI